MPPPSPPTRKKKKSEQTIPTEDNALRKKEEIAKARRIVYSSENRKGRRDLTDKTLLQETVSPSDKSDFAKDMSRELDILERRLSCISQERNQVQQELIVKGTVERIVIKLQRRGCKKERSLLEQN